MSQPYLHQHSIVLQAPVQCWSAHDGHIRTGGAQGIYVGDERVVASMALSVDGLDLEHLNTYEPGGATASYDYVVRTPHLGVDPQLVLHRRRSVTGRGLTEAITISSAATVPQTLILRCLLTPDATPMADIKAGIGSEPSAAASAPSRFEPVQSDGSSVHWCWRDDQTVAALEATSAVLDITEQGYLLRWELTVPARGDAAVSWSLAADDKTAIFIGATSSGVDAPRIDGAPETVNRLLSKAISDLNALRMAESHDPSVAFFAAGSPWFLTLFGRDSLIAARLLSPYDTSIAVSTLRVLAARQGTTVDLTRAEQPGKILHEVRRTALDLHESRQHSNGPSHRVVIPPEYFGTIDATLLWILLLDDLHTAGLSSEELHSFQPALDAALGWLEKYADSDGDGFCEYFDDSGTGLQNQGWKDSGDSIRWANGDQAEGPIALVEVQGYAHGAALAAARLLATTGHPDRAAVWTTWAAGMADRFRASFWVSDELGRYPALALDAAKRPVDGVSSNMGHLLGTGILNEEESRLVVERLLHPSMASGYGVRTMSSTNDGYWPLSYHVGSVWAHDNAIIIDGMLRDGFTSEAAQLASQLLRAAEGLNYRLPELFGGQPAQDVFPPVPYPTSCRPQAWAAASAITVARALTSWP